MPSLPPRPCTAPRCNKMASKGGRCEDHQHKPWASNEGKTASERGYNYKWRKRRERILKRDSYLCQCCLGNGIYTKATDVDHITPKAKGGTDADDNLQSLCNPCHKEKTIRERSQ